MISPFLDHWLESRSVFRLHHWLFLDPFGPLINFYCLDRCFAPDAVVQFPGKLHVCFLLYLLGLLKYIPMLHEWTPPRSLLRRCEWFRTGRGRGRIRFSINGLTATDRERITIVTLSAMLMSLMLYVSHYSSMDKAQTFATDGSMIISSQLTMLSWQHCQIKYLQWWIKLNQVSTMALSSIPIHFA